MNINEFIKGAQVRMNAQREVQKEVEHTKANIETEWRKYVLDEIGAKLPEVLRPYLRWGYDDGDGNTSLYLVIPECTRIDVSVYAHPGWKEKPRYAEFSKKNEYIDGAFDVIQFKCQKHYDDLEYKIYENSVLCTNDVAMAVALAMEIGEHSGGQVLLVEQKNAELKAENERDERRQFCPLLSTIEGHEKCLQHKCAFFLTWKGVDVCAIKTIGEAALDMLPVE